MNLRPLLEETVSQSMPAGESREIARLLLADDKSFLEAYEAEAAGVYEKRFSAQEMRGLADFFAGDLGRKWIASQLEIVKEQVALLRAGLGWQRQVAEIGCETMILGPKLSAAREKAGNPTMPVPTDFVTRYAPVVKGARAFCSCVLKEAVKRSGPTALHYQQGLAQELLKSGVCQLPDFAVPAPPKK